MRSNYSFITLHKIFQNSWIDWQAIFSIAHRLHPNYCNTNDNNRISISKLMKNFYGTINVCRRSRYAIRKAYIALCSSPETRKLVNHAPTVLIIRKNPLGRLRSARASRHPCMTDLCANDTVPPIVRVSVAKVYQPFASCAAMTNRQRTWRVRNRSRWSHATA